MKSARLFALLLPASLAVTALAQTAAPSPAQPLPTDPAALLQLASQVNGLHGSDLKPWHIHATWQKLDSHKHVKAKGTYEEWWASTDDFKIELTAPGFHQIRWTTDKGDFTTGDSGLPAWLFHSIWKDVTLPVAAPEQHPGLRLQRFQEKERATAAMDCVGLHHADSDQPFSGRTCFADGLPAVRFAGGDPVQTAFDAPVQFEGRYVARQIQISPIDMPTIQVVVDAVDELLPGAIAALQPPVGSLPASPWLPVPGLVPGRRVSGYLPTSATDLRIRGLQGSVLLSIQVDKDGMVRDVEAVAGPVVVQQTVTHAAKEWRYSPWTLNGIPVEGQTEFRYSAIQ